MLPVFVPGPNDVWFWISFYVTLQREIRLVVVDFDHFTLHLSRFVKPCVAHIYSNIRSTKLIQLATRVLLMHIQCKHPLLNAADLNSVDSEANTLFMKPTNEHAPVTECQMQFGQQNYKFSNKRIFERLRIFC